MKTKLINKLDEIGEKSLVNQIMHVEIVEEQNKIVIVTPTFFLAQLLERKKSILIRAVREILKNQRVELLISQKSSFQDNQKILFKQQIEFIYKNKGEFLLLAMRTPVFYFYLRFIRKMVGLPQDGFANLDQFLSWESEQLSIRSENYQKLIEELKIAQGILELPAILELLVYYIIGVKTSLGEILSHFDVSNYEKGFSQKESFKPKKKIRLLYTAKDIGYLEGKMPFLVIPIPKEGLSRGYLLEIWDQNKGLFNKTRNNAIANYQENDIQVKARNYIAYRLIRKGFSPKHVIRELVSMGYSEISGDLLKKSVKSIKQRIIKFVPLLKKSINQINRLRKKIDSSGESIIEFIPSPYTKKTYDDF